MRKSLSLALSLLGLFDSVYLLWVYTSPSRPMVCLGGGCDAVRASAYSSLFGLPIPLYGVAAYGCLALLILAETYLPEPLARRTRFIVTGIAGVGFLFSLYLTYLEAFVIHAWCTWCVISALVITCLLALAIWEVVRAAPQPEPVAQLRQQRDHFAVIAGAFVVCVPAFLWLSRHGVPPPVPQASAQVLLERLVRSDSHVTGNPQSPVTVVEFGDFQCPPCGRAEAAAREVRAKYGSRIRFVFRQFPIPQLHPHAEKAAEASECAAEQGKFWEAVDEFYGHQSDLTGSALERYAADLGLDLSRFNQCLAGGAMAARVRRDMEDARALGVRATPTFFVGQKMIEGPMQAAQFFQFIDQELATHAAITSPSVPPVANAPPPVRHNRPESTPTSTAPAPAVGSHPLPASTGALAPASGSIFAKFQASNTACSEEEATQQQPTLVGISEVRQLLEGSPKPLFVDVRPSKEFLGGRIPGALNLPVENIEQQWSTLPKDRTIVLYEGGQSAGDICAASRAVGRVLLARGFPRERVKVYQEGLAGWEKAGLQVEHRPGSPP